MNPPGRRDGTWNDSEPSSRPGWACNSTMESWMSSARCSADGSRPEGKAAPIPTWRVWRRESASAKNCALYALN